MLTSLQIKNYRNLKDLKIASLGRVNLIVGENNTGKSTLLEAVSIYASKCDLNWLVYLLEERGENFKPVPTNLNSFEANTKAFSSLFYGRSRKVSNDNSISIDVLDDSLPKGQIPSTNSISISFAKFIDEIVTFNDTAGENRNYSKRTLISDDDLNDLAGSYVGLEVKIGDASSYSLNLEDDGVLNSLKHNIKRFILPNNFQLVETRDINREIDAKLWDSITLTEKEQYVIDALRIIEPGVERINYVDDNFGGRKPVIKIKGEQNILPLKSMGDGINRILTIILSSTKCDDGYLLIDEFENGLYYSVQEKLWEIIFQLSEKLNIQVFATTHSEDCIRGYERVLNSCQNVGKGKLIRLDNVKGMIRPTEYDAAELKIATENDIETR